MSDLNAILTILVIGLCFGVVGLLVLLFKRNGTIRGDSSLSEQLSKEIGEKVNTAFGESVTTLTELANDKLGTTREAAEESFESKKKLIDQRMTDISKTLKEVTDTLKKYDIDSTQRHTELRTNIEKVSGQAKELTETTTDLGKVLSSSQSRGQWGEKMAEDVLTLAGFIEGINYEKQVTTTTGFSDGGIRPDYTFNLPQGLVLNMDVKFPLDNYARYIAADTDSERQTHEKAFLADVKGHIGTISSKEYNDPSNGTVDYVLMFIPNEGVYEFIFRNGGDVIDTALQQKIIVCSPLTVFAILSVIRQSMDNFAISQTSGQILEVLTGFEKQWDNFKEHMERTEKQLSTFTKSFQALKGTRSNQLDRSIDKIQELKASRDDIEALPDNT